MRALRFCLATCPTYQLTGDELDSPRGRIYLMKQVLEGADVTEDVGSLFDLPLLRIGLPLRVQYGRLADIGREVVEKKSGAESGVTLQRATLKHALPNAALFRQGWPRAA